MNDRQIDHRYFLFISWSPVSASSRIVFAIGGEDVQHFGVFEGRGLMVEAAIDHETITGAEVPLLAFSLEEDVAS